jgi:hypothetical protein
MPAKWIQRFELKPGVWVYVPTPEVAVAGRALKTATGERWHAPSYYYHLSKGGHLSALRAHIGNTFFAHRDIDNFFGSINASRITRWLKPLFGYVSARQYAIESTVLHQQSGEKILPFGFVQSPILASLCLSHSRLGKKLEELHRRKDVTVSLYMDDILVSALDEATLATAVAELDEAAERSRLPFNLAKRTDPGRAVKAFNIVLANQAMEIEVGRLEKLVERHREATSDQVQRGIEAYVRSVSAGQLNALVRELPV